MTPSEVEIFENFLSDCFEDGIRTRELRLSEQEVKFLIGKYPSSSVRQCSVSDDTDGKVWYEVSIRS
jgi:hypothetical protein